MSLPTASSTIFHGALLKHSRNRRAKVLEARRFEDCENEYPQKEDEYLNCGVDSKSEHCCTSHDSGCGANDKNSQAPQESQAPKDSEVPQDSEVQGEEYIRISLDSEPSEVLSRHNLYVNRGYIQALMKPTCPHRCKRHRHHHFCFCFLRPVEDFAEEVVSYQFSRRRHSFNSATTRGKSRRWRVETASDENNSCSHECKECDMETCETKKVRFGTLKGEANALMSTRDAYSLEKLAKWFKSMNISAGKSVTSLSCPFQKSDHAGVGDGQDNLQVMDSHQESKSNVKFEDVSM